MNPFNTEVGDGEKMTDDETIYFQKQLLKLAASQNDLDDISLAEAKFCYLTKEQSDEWVRIGTFSNVHTRSPELELIMEHILDFQSSLNKKITLVDLGCGDGRKIPPLVSALSAAFDVDGFLAVDANKYLLETALSHIKEHSDLPIENCISYQADFEDIKPADINSLLPNSFHLYTFLGNTFNNFPKNQITGILSRLVEKDQAILIGVKTRKDSSVDEQNRLIKEYSSYGPQFTYSYGHVLGLRDDQMEREVVYDKKENRVDIWLRILQPSREMIDAGLSKCKRILAGYRYVPIVEELALWLETYFDVKAYSNGAGTNAVYFCKKP